MKAIRVMFCVIIGIFIADAAIAKIYRLKDQNGNYYYKDIPEEGDSDEVPAQRKAQTNSAGLKDLAAELFARFNPSSAVEKASIGTVTVKTSMGTGSGFFITSNGHIITNKHVLRGDEKRMAEADANIKKIDAEAEKFKKQFVAEGERLARREKMLEDYRNQIEKLTHLPLKASESEKYRMSYEEYLMWKENFTSRKQDFFSKLESYSEKKNDSSYNATVGALASHFTIIIKDGREFNVYLVAESRDTDLALLKLDGYKTPFVKPALRYQTRQGQEVYAIGSPTGLRDSVSSGIISGYERGYIKTNAHVYPGNSGGPLIMTGGEVIGVNTLKMLTRQFEGLGFAIPIETAVSEFENILRGHLPR
jgi:S1-C subfamily serine protease